MYTLNHVNLIRGPAYALHIEHLHIAHGEKVAIIGPSGCGKSTALDMLGLLLEPQPGGSFVFTPRPEQQSTPTQPPPQSIDIAAQWARHSARARDALARLRQRHMGYILQTGGLFPYLTVRENITLQARAAGIETAEDLLQAMVERLQLHHLLAAMPGQLSVGERQRVAIARAVITRPDVILADEPTSALDPVLAQTVMDLFLDEVEAAGSTLIMVTHNVDMAQRANLRLLPIAIAGHRAEATIATLCGA